MRTYAEKFSIIADDYRRTGDYKKMYQKYTEVSREIWDDVDRPDYDSDVWYNLNSNEICAELLGDLCKGKRILSLGAGFWVEKAFLQALDGEVVRTDLIPDDGVMEEDAANLSFADESFDIVICRELIEHVPDEQRVFAEIRRVLKPGGYLLITTPNVYSIAIDGTFHVRGYSPTSFLAELIEQGFKIINKKGNVPYAFHGLKVYATMPKVLQDFITLDEITKGDELRYFMGTNLFVLCQK